MTAAGIDLVLARRESESEMRATCRIIDPATTRGDWNREKLAYDEAEPTVIYTGRCKIRFGKVGVREKDAAGQDYAEHDGWLSIPVDAPGSANVRKHHVAEILTSPDDTALIGALFTVQIARRQSNATSRRFPVKETQ